MLEWIARGLRKGIVTTRYPRSAAPAPEGFRGRIALAGVGAAAPELQAICPTGAIQVAAGRVFLDRGRCILCGACVAHDPDRFTFSPQYETAVRRRTALVIGRGDPGAAGPARRALSDYSRTLRRSIHIRHVDAGSDGGEEWEIQALTNPYYDIQRLGFFFTASPRHADVLLVTGGVTRGMREPLLRAHQAMGDPRAVVAVGTDACSGGFAGATGEVAGGVDAVLPVDVYVPGSPPAPIAILHGLLLATGGLTREAVA
jgi:Ni,Fe-hydrogenase III small subunit/ferredoxin